MKSNKKLINLLENEVIPDITEYIDVLCSKIASKNYLDEDENNLKDMKEMLNDFHEILNEAENDELDEDHCQDIIQEIIEMKQEEKN